MNFNFSLPQTGKFESWINLFVLVLLTIEFLFSVFFFTTDTIRFHCFLYDVKQDNVTYNRTLFFKKYISYILILFYYRIWTIILINLLKFYLLGSFRWLFDVSKYFIDSSKNIKVSLSGSIVRNLEPSSCAADFCLLILQSIFFYIRIFISLCRFSSISIARF